MRLRYIAFFVVASTALAGTAHAQGLASRFQVSLFPNSHLAATSGDTAEQPRFRTYTPGGSLTFAITPHLGVEGDISGSRGTVQSLGLFGRQQSPAMTAVTVNLVADLAPRRLVQPYVTVGVGSIHLFKRAALGMEHGETLDSANIGAGAKIMFRGWGLRADYRYVGMDSTALSRSSFFGETTRHAHRVAMGIVLGPGR